MKGESRVPLIMDYPGLVKSGRTISEPVISNDFYPTLLDLAGLPLEPKQHVDGVSLKPLLNKEKQILAVKPSIFIIPTTTTSTVWAHLVPFVWGITNWLLNMRILPPGCTTLPTTGQKRSI